MDLQERRVRQWVGLPLHGTAAHAQEVAGRDSPLGPHAPVTAVHQPRDMPPGLSARSSPNAGLTASARRRARLLRPAERVGRVAAHVGHSAAEEADQLVYEWVSCRRGNGPRGMRLQAGQWVWFSVQLTANGVSGLQCICYIVLLSWSWTCCYPSSYMHTYSHACMHIFVPL